MKKMKVMILAMAAMAMVTAAPSVTAHAAMGNYNFVSIASGSVDNITVNGVTVEAKYRAYDKSCDTDRTYSCAAFVSRFYREVYGQTVSNLNSIYSTPAVGSGSFSETNSPKVGDVIRGNKSVHWAIVKEVNGGTVTVIQQNAWNSSYTKAWVGATIQIGDPDYTFFTWSGNAGAAGTQQPAKQQGNYSFDYQNPTITDTNAVVSAKVNNPNRVTVGQVGCRLWDANDTLLKEYTENCMRPESRFNMWYDINSELGVTLEKGSVYKYQFYLIDNGSECKGEVQTFTTTGTKSSPKADDAVRTSDQEITDGLEIMQGTLGYEEDWMEDKVGDPKKVEAGVYYYDIEALFGKNAEVTFQMKDGNDEKTTWTYTYGDGTQSSLDYSQQFYDDIVRNAKTYTGDGGKGICKDKNNATFTCQNQYGELKVERNIINKIPVIAITVK